MEALKQRIKNLEDYTKKVKAEERRLREWCELMGNDTKRWERAIKEWEQDLIRQREIVAQERRQISQIIDCFEGVRGYNGYGGGFDFRARRGNGDRGGLNHGGGGGFNSAHGVGGRDLDFVAPGGVAVNHELGVGGSDLNVVSGVGGNKLNSVAPGDVVVNHELGVGGSDLNVVSGVGGNKLNSVAPGDVAVNEGNAGGTNQRTFYRITYSVEEAAKHLSRRD